MRKSLASNFILLLLIFPANACLFNSSRDYEQHTKIAEERIRKNETLKRLDELCQQIPKPKDFEFLGKTAGANTTYVGYTYKTSFRYQQAKEFYDEYFKKEGWELYSEQPYLNSSFEYKKNDDFVDIQCEFKDTCSISCSNKD